MKKFVNDNAWVLISILVVGVGLIYYKNWKAKKELETATS